MKLLRGIFYLALGSMVLGSLGAWLVYRNLERSPGELLRYAQTRLSGHTRLETIAGPVINRLIATVERPVAFDAPVPTLGKGMQAISLPLQRYDASGRPLPTLVAEGEASTYARPIRVATPEELQQAMQQAGPGSVIELQPGIYPHLHDLKTQRAGLATAPIIVTVAHPGSAVLQFEGGEGFKVAHAYWIFENLDIRGICAAHSECEHAFHIYGPARGVVVRNNHITDFNAQIKVNGADGQWPDYGLMQYNTVGNTTPRDTTRPVTPFDLVGANGWIVADNAVSNFVKADGNHVSYGLFMKGASHGGRIERNLLICSAREISRTGARVGISMGGGGTGTAFCRDTRCDTEHSEGIVANNIIAHCNDVGIDVNRSNQILIAHNTLINTAGISLRNPISSADIEANLFEGRIYARDGALQNLAENQIGKVSNYFADSDRLDLAWRDTPPQVTPSARVSNDFCQRQRGNTTLPGAFDSTQRCSLPFADKSPQ